MVNHIELVKDPQKSGSLIEEAISLFIRVKEESGDVLLTRQALFMEALCSLAAHDPNAALALLDGTVAPALPPESLLASAYQMAGNVDEAISVLQVGIYQNIVVLFNFFPAYLMLCTDNHLKFEEVLRRALNVAETFDMKHLHPGVLVSIYIAAAQGYMTQGDRDKTLDMLQQYAEIVTSDIYPLILHGDSFFDHLESWLDKLDLGTDLPRDEKTIKKSMADVILGNPVFSVLANDQRFQSISEKLQNNCKIQ